MRSLQKQISLRPQDLIVCLKLVLLEDKGFTYASLGAELFIAPSEVHSAINRSLLARLIAQDGSANVRAIRAAVREFVLHGLKYAFPAVTGPVARGIPTAYGAPLFRERFQPEEAPVWPFPGGEARGPSLYPLYPGLPKAALKDHRLYDLVSLADAIRVGAAREREFAAQMLAEKLV